MMSYTFNNLLLHFNELEHQDYLIPKDFDVSKNYNRQICDFDIDIVLNYNFNVYKESKENIYDCSLIRLDKEQAAILGRILIELSK